MPRRKDGPLQKWSVSVCWLEHFPPWVRAKQLVNLTNFFLLRREVVVNVSVRSDLIGDYRVGFLLRTPVRQQWLAQAIGTLFASLIAPGIYVLFNSAYSCMNDITDTTCAFQVPAPSAWRAVAMAATDPASAIPPSSLIFSAIMATLGVLSVLTCNFLWGGRWLWVRQYQPNLMVLALAFILPATVYGPAILMGAVLAWYWLREFPKSFEKYGHAVAAGWISGEGIGGVINGGIQILGVSGDAIEGAGFESVDDMFVQYYTATFKEDTTSAWAQSRSRRRSLHTFLAALRATTKNWTSQEVHGYHQQTMESAESFHVAEFATGRKDILEYRNLCAERRSEKSSTPAGQDPIDLHRLWQLLGDFDLSAFLKQNKLAMRRKVLRFSRTFDPYATQLICAPVKRLIPNDPDARALVTVH